MSDVEMRLECLKLALKDGPTPNTQEVAAQYWRFVSAGESHQARQSTAQRPPDNLSG